MTAEERIDELERSYWTTPDDPAKRELARIARDAVNLLRGATPSDCRCVKCRTLRRPFLNTGAVPPDGDGSGQ